MKEKTPKERYLGKNVVIELLIISGNDPLKLRDVTKEDVERVKKEMEVNERGKNKKDSA